MNLAEIERSIKGTEKSLGWVLYRFCPLLQSRLNDPEYQPEIQAQYRKIGGMVSARANLRRKVARTLKDHPELVEALAERTVARLYAHTMMQVVHQRSADKNAHLTYSDLSGEPLPDVSPELKARLEEARQRLFAADLKVQRLSNQIEDLPRKKQTRERRQGLPKCPR